MNLIFLLSKNSNIQEKILFTKYLLTFTLLVVINVNILISNSKTVSREVQGQCNENDVYIPNYLLYLH